MGSKISFCENRIQVVFEVADNGELYLLHMSECDFDETKIPEYCKRLFTAIELQTSGSNQEGHHGAKHTGTTCPTVLLYKSHEFINNTLGKELVFTLSNNVLTVLLHYQFISGAKVVRSYCEITNISREPAGLEYVSSFRLTGFEKEGAAPAKDKLSVMLPHNSWCRELDWKTYTLSQLGFDPINSFSLKRIAISNTGTWSTKEYLPMGFVCNKEASHSYLWQIENNGSWNWEISDTNSFLYLQLSGPGESENGWWKNLQPSETFTSVPAAVAITCGGISEAVAEMTKYRRKIANKNKPKATNFVIFNDYMRCLNADPTTEKLLPVIDAAYNAGCEVFCIDAGWYDIGSWWGSVGEWQVCESRFPGGFSKVFDYIRNKGMLPGIWLEPENMGLYCPAVTKFEDECFFMRHGKKVIENSRYHFDLRNEKVRKYLSDVVDRLISDFGIRYFKFDYNIDAGVGTEIDADSFGDGLLQYNRAYHNWIESIYEKHPDLMIENCGSGGMRMDYATLQHFTIQSLTDSSIYRDIGPTAMASSTAILPEQAAVWSVPMHDESENEIAFHMVNTMFRRIHLSGETYLLDAGKFDIIKKGVEYYKSIRSKIGSLLPFYPIGVANFTDDYICSGYQSENGKELYITLGRFGGEAEIIIPVNGEVKSLRIGYPTNTQAVIGNNGNNIVVNMPINSAVVIEVVIK
jgi:Alpha-galactosidase